MKEVEEEAKFEAPVHDILPTKEEGARKRCSGVWQEADSRKGLRGKEAWRTREGHRAGRPGPGPWPCCEWRRRRQSAQTTWRPSAAGPCPGPPGLAGLSVEGTAPHVIARATQHSTPTQLSASPQWNRIHPEPPLVNELSVCFFCFFLLPCQIYSV